MSRSALRLAIGIPIALIIILGAVGGLTWWKISNLKEQLLANLQKALGAQVQVTSMDIDVWKGELHAAGITLVNQRSTAPWQKGDISQATIHFKLGDLFSSSMPLTVDVSSWNVILHSPLRTAENPPSADSSSEPIGGDVPHQSRVKVTGLSAHGGTVEFDFSDDRKVVLHGVSFEAGDNGPGIWNTQLQATSLDAGSFEAGASAVQIRGEPGKVVFTDLHMQCGQGGVTGEGEVALDGAHAAKLDLKAVDVPVNMLVAAQWQMKLSGFANGNLHYEGNDQGGGAKGQIVVNHGKFNVLPWLGKVTLMVGLPDISDVEVDKATSDFNWKDGTLQFTNLDIRKNDVMRIAGEVDLDSKNQVDGKIKLGLPSSITAKWPQMQDKVFPVALEDYNWAEVHLTGTPDHLDEDLTSRMLAAGMSSGSDLLNSAAQKATDLFHSLMGK